MHKTIRAGLRKESTGGLIGVGCDALVLPLQESPTTLKTMYHLKDIIESAASTKAEINGKMGSGPS